jgi:uncharacterized tellurite resistance protein B-like protein
MEWVIALFVAIVAVVMVVRSTSKSKKGGRNSNDRSDPPTPPADARHRASRGPARRSQKSFDIRWFGENDTLHVGGFTLQGPCVYASFADSPGYLRATDPSEILLQAPVSRPSGPLEDMGYWPWYSRIEPEHRYEYLSWLSSGRTKLPPTDGLLFLYFYGIERRLLLDEADRRWGLMEVVRLRTLDEPRRDTREGSSFRGYSTSLLWHEMARTPTQFDDRSFARVMDLTDRWTPDVITAALAWLAARDRPLPASLARHIAAANPTAQRSVVTKRVPEEFNELFATRYQELVGGEGMALKVSKRPAWHTYRPASGGLSEMRIQVPNPMGIKSQFKKLPEVWNSCIADLRKLSRVSVAAGGEEMTVEAWEALPNELRVDVDHPLTTPVTNIITSHVTDSSEDEAEDAVAACTMVPAGRFAEMLGIERRPKLTASQSRRIAATLESTGYGIVPDARLTPIRHGWDDLVAVLPGIDGTDVDSSRYNAAACVLRLGLSIALADGEADELEIRMLDDHIDAVFDLSPEEQQRIAALRDLLTTTGSDIRPIARKIQEMLPADARKKVGRLLVVMAAATNGVDRSERAALRKAFRALDLAPELLEEAIAEVLPDSSDAEVPVKPARPGTGQGEAIPAPSSPDEFKLNHAAISTIMAETRDVSALLAAAMGAADAEAMNEADPAATDDADGDVVSTSGPSSTTTGPAGPGGRYEPLFVALIDRDRWDREAADEAARSHGLMLDAGVETINDWAYDALGGPLIEDEGDELLIDRSLLDGLS